MKYSSWCQAWPGLPSALMNSIDCIDLTFGPITSRQHVDDAGAAPAPGASRRDLVRVVDAQESAHHVRGRPDDLAQIASTQPFGLGVHLGHLLGAECIGKQDESVSPVGLDQLGTGLVERLR